MACYRINDKFDFAGIGYDGLYEVDPSDLGVQELVNTYPGIYQNAEILKSDQFNVKGLMVGFNYKIHIKDKRWSLKATLLAGILYAKLPGIEIMGNHNTDTIHHTDTADVWNIQSSNSYTFGYMLGISYSYRITKLFSVIVGCDYRGGIFTFNNQAVNYNLDVSQANSSGTVTSTQILYSKISVVNPKVYYQSVNINAGILISF
jgi:hypothetical protein